MCVGFPYPQASFSKQTDRGESLAKNKNQPTKKKKKQNNNTHNKKKTKQPNKSHRQEQQSAQDEEWKSLYCFGFLQVRYMHLSLLQGDTYIVFCLQHSAGDAGTLGT